MKFFRLSHNSSSHNSEGSTFGSITQPLNGANDEKILKSTCLFIQEGDLFWKESYDGLKELIKSDFNLTGKWLSCGGESKECIHRDFVLRWQGKSNQRLVIVKDDHVSYLENGLKCYASEMDDENTRFVSEGSEEKLVKHVVVDFADQDENNTSCHNEDHDQLDLNKIMTMISLN